MPADQILRDRQSEPGAVGTTGNQRIENRVGEFCRYARPVILDLDARDQLVPDLADGKVAENPCTKHDMAVRSHGLHRIARHVEQRLDQLIGVGGQRWQAGIVVTHQAYRIVLFAGDQDYDPLQDFMQVDHLPPRPAERPEQAVSQRGQAVCLADDDAGVLTQLRCWQFTLQKLGGTPQTTERIADLVRELPDHAATGIVLADQCALAVYLSPLGRIKQFDDQIAVAGTGGTDPHSKVIGGRTEAGCRRTEQLPEAVALRRRTLNQLMEISQLRKQDLQRPPEAVTGTQGQEVFGAGVQVVDDSVGIDTDDRGGDAAEDIGGLQCRIYGRTRGRAMGGGLACGFVFCWVPCCT